MVNNKLSDAASPQMPVAPKRKRQVSCLDEQERRQRKRAMDREAQRSLREKTKTRIADLERTIEVLREKDGNSVAASLMSEIDGLRAENERLKQIIDSVRSLVGGNIFSRNIAAVNGEASEKDEDGSPAAIDIVRPGLPELPTSFINPDAKTNPLTDADRPISTEQTPCAGQPTCLGQPASVEQPVSFDQPILTGPIDLDGMDFMANTPILDFQDTNGDVGTNPELQLPTRSVEEQEKEEEEEEELSIQIETETTYKAMLQEIFGPDWRAPSSTILYIGDPARVPQPLPDSPICPLWKKISEILGKIFVYRSHGIARTIAASQSGSKTTEVGLLYLGIKNGWDTIPACEWQRYPALELFRQVDDLVYRHSLKTERLAFGYKSLKLLTYFLNATKQDLDNVPIWLRPRSFSVPTKHPIIIDFFAWPSLRTRFLSHYPLLSRSTALSFYFPRCIRFDWPFPFEDAFFKDESGSYLPSPLFELYTSNLNHWTMQETFYEKFPEMRADIEGDRMAYAHIKG